ncbi:MAG TPA: MBL fold metallo-hydrolase [Chthoniobacteraceae bacterium]|nr:MBL fold metallo-hydrolase [Chthoniobacteraceae bacterium]
MTTVKFWGTRGSVPTPGAATVRYGGNTSCVEVRADGQIIVLDAGTGIRPLGLELAREFNGAPINITLLITHTHWDHIQGFPFFLPAYESKNTIRVLGFEGARQGLGSTLAGQMESPYFPIALQQMPGNVVIEELSDFNFHIGDVKASAAMVNHPGIAVGYRLSTSAGDIAYLPDNELSNDHLQNRKLVDFIAGADVLIIDSQYDCDEYEAHIGWGHGCVDDVVRIAEDGHAKRLYLFHHDPGHDDARVDAMLAHARNLAKGTPLQVFAATEGETITLP